MARATPAEVRATLAALLADRASRPVKGPTFDKMRDWPTPAEVRAALVALLAERNPGAA